MRFTGCLYSALSVLGLSASVLAQVQITQVWGGGGLRADGPRADLVELLNTTSDPVNITGWSLQFRAGNNTGSVWQVRALSGTIPPKRHFLVALTNPAAVGTPYVADQQLTGSQQFDLTVNRGQIALRSTFTSLGAGCPTPSQVIDFVGFGDNLGNVAACPTIFCAECREGGSYADNAPSGDANNSSRWLRRRCDGYLDTGVNAVDFERVGPGAGIPSEFRNTTSARTPGVDLIARINREPVAPNTVVVFKPGETIEINAEASGVCGDVTDVFADLSKLGGVNGTNLQHSGGTSWTFVHQIPLDAPPTFAPLRVTGINPVARTIETFPIVLPPTNDECFAPVAIEGVGDFAWSNDGCTTPADVEGVAPLQCGLPGSARIHNDLWAAWTAPSTGVFTLSTARTIPANFDARIAVWLPGSCPPQQCAAYNDSNLVQPGGPAVLVLRATAGSRYLFQLGSASIAARTPTGVLSITPGSPGGACCSGSNECFIADDAFACSAIGGRNFVLGSSCAGSSRPDCRPIGACCLQTGACLPSIVRATCESTTGFVSWQESGVCGTCPPGGACCTELTGACAVLTEAACASRGKWSRGGTCAPNRCPVPLCCRGSVCAVVTQPSACAKVANREFGVKLVFTHVPCNPAGDADAPCCLSDYNKVGGTSVQDIFDYLNDWFVAEPAANFGGDPNVAPGVSQLFDFLNAWFVRGC